ncbi:hypothetical protein L7F22_006405 [Adiantum nelumboides]|nr:hypothetical protein [Adiantum nelumboides]
MSPGLETGPPSTRGFKALRHGAPTNDSRSTLGQEPMSRNPSHTNVYRKSGLRSDLADWAPSAKPNPHINDPAFASHNLPEWSSLRAGDPTSKPISRIRRDLDWSMRRLMSEDTFEKLIGDPLGRYHFRQFLVQQTGTENKLDLYFDVCQYAKQTEAVRSAAMPFTMCTWLWTRSRMSTCPRIGLDFYSTLRKQYELKTTVAPLQRHLLQSLYRGEFQNFVKAKLVEHNKVRLGTLMDDSAGGTSASGLGDCFCLTNPRLRENPIVLVSPGFTALTGYPATSIIGRNCRFLSGPGTAPNSIQRIRDALNAGSSCTELLLNYKRDGQPFFNLLTILPLRDATGNLVYFIGGQTEVTSQLASSKGLSWLLGGGDDVLPVSVTAAAQHNTINGVEVSPQMARYLQEADRMKGFASHEDDASDDGFSMAGGSSFRGDGDFDGPSLARPACQPIVRGRTAQRQRQPATMTPTHLRDLPQTKWCPIWPLPHRLVPPGEAMPVAPRLVSVSSPVSSVAEAVKSQRVATRNKSRVVATSKVCRGSPALSSSSSVTRIPSKTRWVRYRLCYVLSLSLLTSLERS